MSFNLWRSLKREPTEWQRELCDASGETMLVDFKHHPKAKRFILRLDAKTQHGRVTVPLGASPKQAESFAAKHMDWLIAESQKRFFAKKSRSPLSYGHKVPWDGGELKLAQTEKVSPFVAGECLYIPARRDLRQATLAFFASAARMDMTPRIFHYENRLKGLRTDTTSVQKIRITDTTSRWGSCSSRGVISLSKRLMMAPGWVRNYVCAHEVAHLAQQDHSAKFWSLYQQLEPQISSATARQFLRQQGSKYFGFASL